MPFSGNPIPLIILATTLFGRSFCCQHDKFILDYAELYSLSRVAIMVREEENNPVQPMMHLSAAYISYDPSEVRRIVEYIVSVKDEIEALFFIGTDHSNLIHMLDNNTDTFHSEIMSVMDNHPIMDFRLRLDTNILFCNQEGKSYTLTEDYAIKGGPKITVDVGAWSEEVGLRVSHPLLWERRSDLKNVEITNSIMSWSILNYYREVQVDFTPEMEVLYMLFERYHIKNRKRSFKQAIKYFNFRSKIQLDHPVQVQR